MTKSAMSAVSMGVTEVGFSRGRSRLQRLISHDIAIDLGTANTLIHVEGQGIVVNEPSVVATNKRTKRVIAIGSDAKKMIGRTPNSIIASKPLVNGVVSDYDTAEFMLQDYMGALHKKFKVLIQRPRVVVGLPSGVTEVEKRAVEEAARSAGARKVFLIEEPVAAAIGAGIDIHEETGVMMVDIGGGTTEIGVIANGRMVVGSSVRVAGDNLTSVIKQFVRDEHNLLVGERTAETIKTTIGAVFAHADKKTMAVRGRNTITGLPQEVEIRSDILRIPLAKQLRPVMDAIKAVLEQTPPELLSDIMQHGIYVAGGGGHLAGIDHLIKQETHIDVLIPNNTLTAVVEGAARAMQEPEKYKRVLMTGE